MTVDELRSELERLRAWVNDLQSGMYINCVYCGHRYGPDPGTPVAMAEVLKRHIEECPKHPASVYRKALERIAKRSIKADAGVQVAARMRQDARDALAQAKEGR
jgi:hypothetical protein